MVEVPVGGPRLHVVASVLKAQASLPPRLLDLLVAPAKERDLCILHRFVNDSGGFLGELRSKDAQEELGSGSCRVFEDSKCVPLSVLRFRRLTRNRDE